jgi:hypothetical protein
MEFLKAVRQPHTGDYAREALIRMCAGLEAGGGYNCCLQRRGT